MGESITDGRTSAAHGAVVSRRKFAPFEKRVRGGRGSNEWTRSKKRQKPANFLRDAHQTIVPNGMLLASRMSMAPTYSGSTGPRMMRGAPVHENRMPRKWVIMKISVMLAILCTSLPLGSAALADDDLADQAYNEGWDAASNFCNDVDAGSYNMSYESRSISQRFRRNCKQGFDAYIDNNRSCKRKLRDTEDGYRAAWRARGESCN